MEAWVLAYLGKTLGDEANEKPAPNKSINITLANWVARFALSDTAPSIETILGPIPPRFIYWAERPGVPTAMIVGLLLKLSALVYPSIP